jgi:hypothetical protein
LKNLVYTNVAIFKDTVFVTITVFVVDGWIVDVLVTVDFALEQVVNLRPDLALTVSVDIGNSGKKAYL